MMRVDMKQLESDYEIAQSLMKNHKYVQAVVHLEKLLKQTYDDTSKDLFKNLYKDIISAYRSINNKTRADYYYTKAVGLFGEFEDFSVKKEMKSSEDVIEISTILDTETIFEEKLVEDFEETLEIPNEIIVNEPKIQNEINSNTEMKLGESIVLRTANDFEMLKTPFKIKASDTNEMNFNNIFVEIFTAVESKKYFGYFKLNLNKLNDCLNKGIENLEKNSLNKLKWELNILLNLIEENGISSFDSLYRLEFEHIFDESIITEKREEFEPNVVSFENTGTFTFKEEQPKEIVMNFDKDNHEEIKKGIDKIVEKNRDVFEDHNILFSLDKDYNNEDLPEGNTDEIFEMNEQVLDLNMENSIPKINQNETIIVEINTEKVKENNLEVSKVKDVVLEVLENLRKADLDIFTELKDQAEDRAQKVGTEREKRGLLSGLEGMLEIKFGVVSLDIVPEMKKINELDRLYEVKEKILATRDFTEVEKIVGITKG